MSKIGAKIKQARKLKNITQEDLAKALGVSDKSVSAYEVNRASPPIEILTKIANATHQPVSYFFEEDNEDAAVLAKLRVVEEELKEIKKLLEEKKA